MASRLWGTLRAARLFLKARRRRRSANKLSLKSKLEDFEGVAYPSEQERADIEEMIALKNKRNNMADDVPIENPLNLALNRFFLPNLHYTWSGYTRCISAMDYLYKTHHLLQFCSVCKVFNEER